MADSLEESYLRSRRGLLRADEKCLRRYLRRTRRARTGRERKILLLLTLLSAVYLAGMAAAGGKLTAVTEDHEILWQPAGENSRDIVRIHVNLSRGELTVTRETLR